jgi:FtsH-binding integral membrane protein
MIFIGLGFLRLVFPWSSLNESLYAGLGSLLFSFCIIMDTQFMLKRASGDQYVIASLQIYMVCSKIPDCANSMVFLCRTLSICLSKY